VLKQLWLRILLAGTIWVAMLLAATLLGLL
jgi:hypothetical protein